MKEADIRPELLLQENARLQTADAKKLLATQKDFIEVPGYGTFCEEIKELGYFEEVVDLFWPRDFLLACAKALPTGGLLILTTPNSKGFDLLTLGPLSNNIYGPNHLNYFNPQSLGLLLENTGFEVVEIMTPGKLDAELVRKKLASGELDEARNPFLKYILLDQWETIGPAFQSFLASNRLSSHLWVVAKKI